MIKLIKQKGFSSIPIAVAYSIGTVVIGALIAYYTAQGTSADKVSGISERVAVVETKSSNEAQDISDIKDGIKTLNDEMTQILLLNGGGLPAKLPQTNVPKN